jgi:hypothetical protein
MPQQWEKLKIKQSLFMKKEEKEEKSRPKWKEDKKNENT